MWSYNNPALDFTQHSGDWMVVGSTLLAGQLEKTHRPLKLTLRRAKMGSQTKTESFSLEVAEPRVQHQEADQPRPDRKGQKRPLDQADDEPQLKRAKVQGTALDITQLSEDIKEDEKDLFTWFVEPIQETCRRLKLTLKCVKKGSQVTTESLAPEVAEPTVQHQGFKKEDQPQPERRGQKRPSNLKDEDKPLLKRPRIQRNNQKAGVLHPSTQPKHLMAYEKGFLLGKGGFGSVYAGIRKADGLPVAIKYVSKRRQDDQELECEEPGLLPTEIELMLIMNKQPFCSNILQMLDWYDEPHRYIMILERPEPCEDLHKFCHRHGGYLPERVARNVMVQLIKALKHCKSCGVVHRDVKPANILIRTDTQQVKLFDFGSGERVRDIYTDFAGTSLYNPPEWYKKKRFWPEPGTVWSVGVTLYRLVYGFVPFRKTKKIKEGRLDFPGNLSQECRDLIRWCLHKKAAKRPSLEQIELHDWFNLPG